MPCQRTGFLFPITSLPPKYSKPLGIQRFDVFTAIFSICINESFQSAAAVERPLNESFGTGGMWKAKRYQFINRYSLVDEHLVYVSTPSHVIPWRRATYTGDEIIFTERLWKKEKETYNRERGRDREREREREGGLRLTPSVWLTDWLWVWVCGRERVTERGRKGEKDRLINSQANKNRS